ncbi:HEAT repeat domain-containing protein [Actinomadura sp. 9N215]|uniref:HEAT repeat domain-containing protein n=1 Tax=Actinomadura sp. 9N215 TaxID=3375150 RepID=UPI0037AEE677
MLNEAYAVKIARDLYVPVSGAGFVTRFEFDADAEFARRYPVRRTGDGTIRELRVPVEDLAEFNARLAGPIHVVHEFHAPGYGPLATRVIQAAAGRQHSDEVVAMLTVAAAKTWIGLDRALRTSAPAYGGRPVGAKERLPEDARLSRLVAACSRTGHRRESAVTGPVMRTDELLLPVLVLRTADWVPQVRERARRSFAIALRSAGAPALLAMASAAVAIGSWARGGHALEAVAGALRKAPDGVLASARVHPDIGVRRLAYRLWLASDRPRREEVMRAALREHDGVCRLQCAEWLVAGAVRDGNVEVLERLLRRGSAKVGIEALTALVKLGRPESGAAHLADRSALMRATAQWAVRRADRSPAAIYRDALTLDRPPGRARALVAGLGECGTRQDVDVLLPFLEHPSPRVRAEAVRAVRRLGGPVTRIARMLTDPAPVVVHATKQALHNQPDAVPAVELWALLDAGIPPHVRLAAYDQLREKDTWTRVHVDLHLLATGDGQLGDRARADLTVWSRRAAATAYRPPTGEMTRLLGQLIDTAEALIGARQAHRLRWILGIR